VVLKIERTPAYPGLVALEAMALDLHREAGFEVPRYWHAEVGGLPALAIARFDRDARGGPLPQESLFSVLAAGARDIERNTDGSLDRIGRVIDLADPALIADRRAAREHLFRRLLLALLTGNGDLHLDNLSLLGPEGEARFSPVYDPTPMRAYSRHDMLCAVPFGGYGEKAPHGDPLVDACLTFAANIGLRKASVRDSVAELLALIGDYPERVEAVPGLPADNKARLASIHRDICRRLQRLG
jgi:serine/threonine-protein kinase HipA